MRRVAPRQHRRFWRRHQLSRHRLAAVGLGHNPSECRDGSHPRPSRRPVFLGTIIEGPSKWSVRPVAEFFVEKEFGQFNTISALVGLIWQLRDGLSVDVGLRHALTNGRPGNEVRAGVTYDFPLRALDARTAQYR